MFPLVGMLKGWRARAACRRVPQRVFYGSGPHAEARLICAECPVRLDCLEEALALEPMALCLRFGVRGGLGPGERQVLMEETLALYALDHTHELV